MVGIGVGIDYALLLVTRYVEGLRAGLPVRAAAARANGTAGVSVVFAGTTVLVSLFGLAAGRRCRSIRRSGWPPCWWCSR